MAPLISVTDWWSTPWQEMGERGAQGSRDMSTESWLRSWGQLDEHGRHIRRKRPDERCQLDQLDRADLERHLLIHDRRDDFSDYFNHLVVRRLLCLPCLRS